MAQGDKYGALGSSSADFERCISAHLPSMLRLACSMTSLSEAPDVVQDALLVAWSKRAMYSPALGDLQGWLLGIVFNQSRRRWRRRDAGFKLRDIGSAVAAPDPTTTDVRIAVNRLPSRQRAAIVLYYYVGLPIVDVATVMNCSAGTVKSALHDARLNLRAALGESYARA